MMVYCKDRSTRLPRRKGRYIKRKPPLADGRNRTVTPFRPVINNAPSVLERRCEGGKWRSKEDDEAMALLDSIINGGV